MTTSQRKYSCLRTFAQARELSLSDIEKQVDPTSILMCEPTCFDVKETKNAFMKGQVGKVDVALAQRQWFEVKSAFEKCGYPVHVVPAVDGFEDMVFAANQVLPGVKPRFADGGADGAAASAPYVVPARMAYQSRQREIPYYLDWFKQQKYEILPLCATTEAMPVFEGQGDAIWHPGHRLLWLGFGNRTEERSAPLLCQLLDVPVAMLRLTTATFYHLDTCFAALDENTVVIYPPAFDDESLRLIRHCFNRVIEVPESDAFNFACNCVALGHNVVLQKGSRQTCAQLESAGFNPVEVDTSEFMKSGGSVFCMKMMVY
ncbi:MAG TPA: arginine deiminase-related protein [Planktothrix sp.]|jgi:N-dimethylarginine dimethylaminohydrolase